MDMLFTVELYGNLWFSKFLYHFHGNHRHYNEPNDFISQCHDDWNSVMACLVVDLYLCQTVEMEEEPEVPKYKWETIEIQIYIYYKKMWSKNYGNLRWRVWSFRTCLVYWEFCYLNLTKKSQTKWLQIIRRNKTLKTYKYGRRRRIRRRRNHTKSRLLL